jgi:PAS domain S-box-containing protein/putative nucleotidyltransferase with HDIG domain
MKSEGHSRFADILRHSEGSLSSLLSLFEDTLVFIFDSSGRFVFGHSDKPTSLHADPSAFIGKRVGDVLPDRINHAFIKAFEENRKGEQAEFDYWLDMITHTGWFSARCSPIFRDGSFDGTLAIVRDITEKRMTEENLRVSEENYRKLVETAAMGILIVRSGRIIYSNPHTSLITGFTCLETTGKPFIELIAPAHRKNLTGDGFPSGAAENDETIWETKVLRKNGRLTHVEVRTRTVTFQGECAVMVLLEDITKRKQAENDLLSMQETLRQKVAQRTEELNRYKSHLEEKVEERTARLRENVRLLRNEIEERITAESRAEHLNKVLKAIRNINQLIIGAEETKALIQGICRSLVETRGYEKAWILLIAHDGTVDCHAEAAEGDNAQSHCCNTGDGSIAPCVSRSLETSEAWCDYETSSMCHRCAQAVNSRGPARILGCRLEYREKVFGVLHATSPSTASPDEEEIELFQEVCNDIAFALDAIEHHRVNKSALTSLEESRNRYRTLFENATAAILFLNGDSIIDCNSKCASIFHTKKEFLKGKTPWELSPETQPDGRPSKDAAHEYISKALETGAQYFRWVHLRPGGEEFIAEVGLNPVEIDGVTYTQAVLNDITTREKAETALRTSEKNYRTLYSNVPVGLFRSTTGNEGRLLEANPAMAAIFGFSQPEEMLPVRLENLYACSEERARLIERVLSDGMVKDYEARMKRRDGSLFWASISARLTGEGENDEPALDGILQDITETRAYEDSLRSTLESQSKTIDGTVSAMSLLVEMKDPYTSGHQKSVADLACSIATEMGLTDDSIRCLRIAAVLHDLGKFRVPLEILSKPGALSSFEVEFLKTHPSAGYDILKSIEFPWPVAEIVLQHHERMNGSGYPQGLKGQDILLEARIIAVADVVEATASRRPYRASRGIEKALESVEEGSGILYDPAVVSCCLMLFRERGYQLPEHENPDIRTDFYPGINSFRMQ